MKPQGMLRSHWQLFVLGAAIACATALLLYLGRGQTPAVDQWAYIYFYRSWSLESLLTPHSGHLIVLPLILYKLFAELFGLESQLPFQLLNLALSATVGVLLYALIRRAVGDLLAIGAAVLMLFYGAGADVLIPTFQITNLLGLACGMGMLLALRRERLGWDVAASLLLAASLASFSIGVAFAAGAAVMVGFRPSGQRLRSAWIAVAPLVLYGAWLIWARKFGDHTLYIHNLKTLGSAVADQIGAALSGLSGLFTTPNGPAPSDNPIPIRTTWAPALAVGLAALLILRLRRPSRPGRDAYAALAVLVVYLLLVALSLNAFRNTFDTRLVYLASVLLLIVVAELCGPYRPTRTVLAVAGIAFFFSFCANVVELSDAGVFWRSYSATIRATLGAVAVASDAANPAQAVEEPPGAMGFDVATFHELESEFGLPGDSEAELLAASPADRQTADEELVRIEEIAPRPTVRVTPSESASPLAAESHSGGEVSQEQACLRLAPKPAATTKVTLQLPASGIAYESAAPVEASLGRFGDAPAVALAARAGASELAIPADQSSAPWRAELKATRDTLVCPAG
jgi:hypothetical protein